MKTKCGCAMVKSVALFNNDYVKYGELQNKTTLYAGVKICMSPYNNTSILILCVWDIPVT